MREEEANEEAKLSEFQEELVQLAASLNGDHTKDTFPTKLVENMTVIEAVNYVGDAYKKFCDDCHKARENGADESHIVCDVEDPTKPEKPAPKSFTNKLFSCLVCDN